MGINGMRRTTDRPPTTPRPTTPETAAATQPPPQTPHKELLFSALAAQRKNAPEEIDGKIHTYACAKAYIAVWQYLLSHNDPATLHKKFAEIFEEHYTAAMKKAGRDRLDREELEQVAKEGALSNSAGR